MNTRKASIDASDLEKKTLAFTNANSKGNTLLIPKISNNPVLQSPNKSLSGNSSTESFSEFNPKSAKISEPLFETPKKPAINIINPEGISTAYRPELSVNTSNNYKENTNKPVEIFNNNMNNSLFSFGASKTQFSNSTQNMLNTTSSTN